MTARSAGTELYEEMIGLFADIEVVRLPGGHHLHLEGAEVEIAARTLRFLGPRV